MPAVTILIPVYQERAFIRACLQSVLAFEDPENAVVEIFVLDGLSTDGTRELVAELAAVETRIRLIDNPDRTQSVALNAGIRAASGDLIMRLDAHSAYPSNYLKLAVETSARTGADNVGGIVVTLPRNDGYQASLVQAITTHRVGVGNSGFRTNAKEGEADTVPYGCFKRAIFERVGFFDERLKRAQDYEMNRRISTAGGRVWLNPAMEVSYFNQPDLMSFLRKQMLTDAPYNAYMWYVAPYTFAVRHAVTAVFTLGIILGLLLGRFIPIIGSICLFAITVYGIVVLATGVQQAVRYRRPAHVLTVPLALFSYHFLHGAGVLYGLARLLTRTAPVQAGTEPWKGAGRFRAWPP